MDNTTLPDVSLWAFIVATGTHWVPLMTGGFFALLMAWLSLFSSIDKRKLAGLWLAGGVLLIGWSGFLVWRDGQRKVDRALGRAREAEGRLENHIREEHASNFDAKTDFLFFARYDHQVDLWIHEIIANKGAESIVKGYAAFLASPSGKRFPDLRLTGTKPRPTYIPADESYFSRFNIDSSDSLDIKTQRERVPRAGQAGGWLRFIGASDEDLADINKEGATLSLGLQDGYDRGYNFFYSFPSGSCESSRCAECFNKSYLP